MQLSAQGLRRSERLPKALEIEGKRYSLKVFVVEIGESENKNAFLAGT